MMRKKFNRAHLASCLLDVSKLKQACDDKTQEQADQRHRQTELAQSPEAQLVPAGGALTAGLLKDATAAATAAAFVVTFATL